MRVRQGESLRLSFLSKRNVRLRDVERPVLRDGNDDRLVFCGIEELYITCPLGRLIGKLRDINLLSPIAIADIRLFTNAQPVGQRLDADINIGSYADAEGTAQFIDLKGRSIDIEFSRKGLLDGKSSADAQRTVADGNGGTAVTTCRIGRHIKQERCGL